MVYVELALLGGIIFVLTAIGDYLVSSEDSHEFTPSHSTYNPGRAESPTETTDIVVGSQRPGKEISTIARIKESLKVPAVWYIVAVILQTPFLLSTLGVI